MARNKSSDDDNQLVSWLEGSFSLSFLLFFSTYTILGWAIASRVRSWYSFLEEKNLILFPEIGADSWFFILKLLALGVIISISLIFTNPVGLISFIFEESINSDVKAFIAILFWSILFVVIFCYFHYFADLLVVTSANILFRMDLDKLKYQSWLVTLIIIMLALVSFSLGVFAFDYFSFQP